MAITKNMIREYIESLDLVTKEENDLLVYDPDTPSIEIEFSVTDNGKTFRTMAISTILQNMIAKVSQENFESVKLEIYEFLLNYNSKTKFGTWEANGKELIYTVEIPVEDSSITMLQFKRIFNQVDHQSKTFNELITIVKKVYN